MKEGSLPQHLRVRYSVKQMKELLSVSSITGRTCGIKQEIDVVHDIGDVYEIVAVGIRPKTAADRWRPAKSDVVHQNYQVDDIGRAVIVIITAGKY